MIEQLFLVKHLSGFFLIINSDAKRWPKGARRLKCGFFDFLMPFKSFFFFSELESLLYGIYFLHANIQSWEARRAFNRQYPLKGIFVPYSLPKNVPRPIQAQQEIAASEKLYDFDQENNNKQFEHFEGKLRQLIFFFLFSFLLL